MTPETEADLRAQIAAYQSLLGKAAPLIPELPAEHDGVAIDWGRWEEAPWILAHVPNGCEQCDHPGPILLAFGLAGPGRPTRRFRASRCRSCQETTVYRVEPVTLGLPRMRYIEIAYHPPRTVPSPPTITEPL